MEVVDFSQARVDLGSPFIVRGGCERARTKWTEEWLLEFFGERSCRVSLDSRPAMEAYKTRSSLREYLQLHSTGLEYLFQTEFNDSTASALLADLDLPPDLLRLPATGLYRFYAGPANAGTLPHVHTHAINALIRGQKRWAIYAGVDDTETAAMAKEAYQRYGSGSQARDWFVRECPKLRSGTSRYWEFVQSAGEVVFIPALHLHAALNLEPAIGFALEFHESNRT